MRTYNFVFLFLLSISLTACFGGARTISSSDSNGGASTSEYSWRVGSWSVCSATQCNTQGTRTREVVCEDQDGQIVSDGNCSDTPRPTSSEACTPPGCGTASCTLDNVTVPHMQSRDFFNSTTVACGQTCQSISRTCNNGTLSGNAAYNRASCSVSSCPPPAGTQNIQISPNGTVTANELVTLGIPFAPGILTDANRVQIFDDNNAEVAAFVKPVLRWHFIDNSIRSVQVQFYVNVSQGLKNYRFAYTTPRTSSITQQNYNLGLKQTTAPRFAGVMESKVYATLSPEWMTTSLIAGPQSVNASNRQETFSARQFDVWAGGITYNNTSAHAWLFDRATTIGKMYVKTGDVKYLKEFFTSWRYYSQSQFFGACGNGTGWNDGSTNVCDVKYTYVQPTLLAMGLLGDDTSMSATTLNSIGQNLINGGWNGNFMRPYSSPSQAFTERNVGVQLRGLVAVYEMTGNATHLNAIVDGITNLNTMVNNNPDGFAADGCPRHSWAAHEGDTYPGNIANDRGCSPWMMAMYMGAVYQSYQLLKHISSHATTAQTALNLISVGAQYMANYGMVSQALITANGGSGWKSSCNTGALTDQVQYWSSSTANTSTMVNLMNDSGWGSDAHNPEVWNTLNYSALLETNATRRNNLVAVLNRLEGYLNNSCANTGGTIRAFNWQNYDVNKGIR